MIQIESGLRQYIEEKIYSELPLCVVNVMDELPFLEHVYDIRIHYYAYGEYEGCMVRLDANVDSIAKLEERIRELLDYIHSLLQDQKVAYEQRKNKKIESEDK